MTHLIDTSALHKYARFPGVRGAIDALRKENVVLTTCPPVIAEFCFSARSASEMVTYQNKISSLYCLDSVRLAPTVARIQSALWGQGFARGAGSIDVLTAAYALARQQVLVTCDKDHAIIAKSLAMSGSSELLPVMSIAENGDVTQY